MPRKILIVDDNAINRMMLKNTLSGDYDILEASNGRDALAMLAEDDELSAVLLDIVMPEMDGYEVLRRIRDNVQISQIPVIMVTGSEDEESRVKALTIGANDFIVKPFSPEIVKHCLKNNIALREAAAAVNILQRDRLTGIWNREAFFQRASAMIEGAPAGYYILGCVDIDNFKVVNDQYGSGMGDRVLRSIADALLDSCEVNGGICGRIFADCFISLYPKSLAETVAIGPHMMEARILKDTGIKLTLSVGRYYVEDKALSVSAMYDRATIAQSTVKGRYDTHIAVYDESMRSHLVHEQRIVNDMHAALTGRQFEAWYQPQYNHATGALIGAEALVRWRHPLKGLVPPGEFIPVFERNGFVYEMDKYIWEEVCARLRAWLDAGASPLPVSVNISRHDIFFGDLEAVLSGLVKKYDIPAELLRLEITETAFAKSTEQIVNVVKRLVGHGFIVEIDDFGSGYSSLNTLKDVPAQILKLDMKFLEGGDNTNRSGNIVEAVVRMAKWLGMSVIAEGVETVEQANYLRSIGCVYLQGYLFARPMPASEYEKLFSGSAREGRLLKMESVVNLDNSMFWDPKSMDTLIFNSYVGAACVFEYYNRRVELLRVNTKFTRILGDGTMTVEDTLKLDWITCLAPESLELVREILRLSGETGDEYTCEYVLLNIPGGPPRTYLRATMRVIASAGQRQLIYCTSENVTAQRQAEENERLAERKSAVAAGQLQAVLDSVGCGITAITYGEKDVEYLMINDRYFELLGYAREQYERLETFSPICEEDRSRVMDASRRAYDENRPVTVEFRAVRGDGKLIWLRDAMTMTRIPGIDAPVQLSMFSDITEEKRAESEAPDRSLY